MPDTPPSPFIDNAENDTIVLAPERGHDSTPQSLFEPATLQRLEEGIRLHHEVKSRLQNDFHIVEDGVEHECLSTEGLLRLPQALRNAVAEQNRRSELHKESSRMHDAVKAARDKAVSDSTLPNPKALLDRFKNVELNEIQSKSFQTIVNFMKTHPEYIPKLQDELQVLGAESSEAIKQAYDSNLLLTKQVEQLENAQRRLIDDAAEHYATSKEFQAKFDSVSKELLAALEMNIITSETATLLRQERGASEDKYQELSKTHGVLLLNVEKKEREYLRVKTRGDNAKQQFDELMAKIEVAAEELGIESCPTMVNDVLHHAKTEPYIRGLFEQERAEAFRRKCASERFEKEAVASASQLERVANNLALANRQLREQDKCNEIGKKAISDLVLAEQRLKAMAKTVEFSRLREQSTSDELQVSQGKLSEFEQSIGKFKITLDDAHTENNSLKKMLEDRSKELLEARQTTNDVQSQLDQSNNLAAALNQEKIRLELSQTKHTENEVQLQAFVTALQTSLSDSKREIDALKAENASLVKRNQDQTQMTDTLREDLDSAHTALSYGATDNDNLQFKTWDLEFENAECEDLLDSLKVDLQTLTEANTILDVQGSNSILENARLTELSNSRQWRINQIQAELLASKADCVKLESFRSAYHNAVSTNESQAHKAAQTESKLIELQHEIDEQKALATTTARTNEQLQEDQAAFQQRFETSQLHSSHLLSAIAAGFALQNTSDFHWLMPSLMELSSTLSDGGRSALQTSTPNHTTISDSGNDMSPTIRVIPSGLQMLYEAHDSSSDHLSYGFINATASSMESNDHSCILFGSCVLYNICRTKLSETAITRTLSNNDELFKVLRCMEVVSSHVTATKVKAQLLRMLSSIQGGSHATTGIILAMIKHIRGKLNGLSDTLASYIRHDVMAVELEGFTIIANTHKTTVCNENDQIAIVDSSRITLGIDERLRFRLTFMHAPLIGTRDFVVSKVVVFEKLHSLRP